MKQSCKMLQNVSKCCKRFVEKKGNLLQPLAAFCNLLRLTILLLAFNLPTLFAAEKTTLAKAAAPSISVKAEVNKAFITIGDPMTYTVSIKHAPDVQILSSVTPPPEDTFKLKKVEDINRKEGTSLVEGRKYLLTCFRLGEFILDPQEIKYREGGGEVKTIQTDKIYVTVKSVAEGEEKKDIRGIKSVLRLEASLVPWIITGIILLLFVTGLVIYRRLKKSKDQPAEPEIKLTLEEQAILELTQLYESDLLRKGKVKEYHLKLSEILKNYFERRFQILAVESTTDEINKMLRQKNIEMKLRNKIAEVLEAADLAKFAKWKPDPQVIKEHFQKSKEIIEEAKPAAVQGGGNLS